MSHDLHNSRTLTSVRQENIWYGSVPEASRTRHAVNKRKRSRHADPDDAFLASVGTGHSEDRSGLSHNLKKEEIRFISYFVSFLASFASYGIGFSPLADIASLTFESGCHDPNLETFAVFDGANSKG
jgi:hypothetical protein